MTYQAVIFDAFGTILQLRSGVHTYRQLLREGMRNGRRPRFDDVQKIMAFNGGLSACADYLGIQIQPRRLLEIESELDDEVSAIEAFPDAHEAIRFLQQHRMRIGVCSNLAQPYGRAVRRHFPALDAYTFSYEVGRTKPDPQMYSSTCEALGLGVVQVFGNQQVVMIGDSLRCDCHGPRQVGITGIHLERSPPGQISNLMEFAKFVVGTRESLTRSAQAI